MVPWLNWIEQPPPKGQVGGSNPLGITIPLFTMLNAAADLFCGLFVVMACPLLRWPARVIGRQQAGTSPFWWGCPSLTGKVAWRVAGLRGFAEN